MKSRRWYYFLPVLGVVFGLWYLNQSFVDVVYSDYIRLVNSYLPDIWNPEKFFVGDLLTRIPVSYAARIINVLFFDYQIVFDQVLGMISLGLSAMLVASYCVKKEIRTLWFACLMAVMFSLNKWEMMTNGSSWIHCFAFVGFYCHDLILERVWNGREKKQDRAMLLVFPWVMTLGVAGPYCAVYTVVLVLAYVLRLMQQKAKEGRWEMYWLFCSLSAMLPLFLYIWSNSQVTEPRVGVTDASLITQLLDTPGFFLRFLIKSFSSMVIGGECAQAVFTSNVPYMVFGILVMASYVLALMFQYQYRLYEETIFPLMLISSGGLSHGLIMVSRWTFLQEDYGMSSRYALQFQAGILGILLTFALVWEKMILVRKQKDLEYHQGYNKLLTKVCMAAITLIFLAGNGYTTGQELKKAPARKNACAARAELALDFENRTDEELRANFEYHTSRPEGGQEVRAALEILKEHHWNIFRE